MAVLAVYFFKERTIILDAALQSFQLLHQDKLAIQVNRFGAAMTQVFPWVALQLKLPLKAVLILYSLGFVLVHWLMFTLCDSWLKAKSMAFAILLFSIFMVNHTFFWTQNEIIQATSLSFVFWAILHRFGSGTKMPWWLLFPGLPLLATLSFFHPLIVFPFAFAGGYFLLDNYEGDSEKLPSRLILSALIFFAGFIALKYLAFPNWYDTVTTGRLSIQNINTFFNDIFAANGFQTFLRHLLNDFYLLPLALLFITAFYIQRRFYIKLFFLWASVLCYIVMVMIAYIEGGFWFHVESQYLPVSVFVILPMVWDVIPGLAKSVQRVKIMTSALVLVVLIRLTDIVQTGKFYSGRISFIASALQQTYGLEGRKFIIEEELVDKTYLMQSWSFGYETLYYSALQSPDSTRTITILPNIVEEPWRLTEPAKYLPFGNAVPYREIPKHLFNFSDSTVNYRVIRAADIDGGRLKLQK
jgi:hypothetical protein